MSVTNYTPGQDGIKCKYTYDKLKNVIYLVSAEHVKDVHIDEGNAYINDLTELPLVISGFNISFNEESSLDERYKFTKVLRLSMHGYVSHLAFSGRYYAIIESEDGTLWMINVDFPSKVTYTFELSNNTYQTDFTFTSQSNFPTLRLATSFEAVAPECIGYDTGGVKSLKLLEKDYAMIDTENKKVYTYGKDFQVIEFLGKSCKFQEAFNGDNVTTTITFDIGFDAYKSSWHYNLLEFTKNLYAAIVTPESNDNSFYAGFNFGLQPGFSVNAVTNAGETDKITITLIEASDHGSTAASDWDEEHRHDTWWTYVKYVDDIPTYECVSLGMAKYLVQAEMIGNGVYTGNYKCLEGYREYFEGLGLNIVDTFSSTELFSNSECSGESCKVITNIPNTITFRSATCNTYTYSASCDWNVTGLADYLTVTPMSGVAGQPYTVEICNTVEPTGTESTRFNITAGDNTKVVNVNITTSSGILDPEEASINCLKQDVVFTFDPDCPITVTGINPKLSYKITNQQLIVTVPRNYSTTDVLTWAITVKNCRDIYETVIITQDVTYEKWSQTSGYICDGTTSYTKLERFTGTTAGNINTRTGEYKIGTKIMDSDPRCSSYETRWIFNNHFYCINGDKVQAIEEEISYDGGTTWTPTGATRLGEVVESHSAWCESDVEYEWRISTRWVCGDGSENNNQ